MGDTLGKSKNLGQDSAARPWDLAASPVAEWADGAQRSYSGQIHIERAAA